MNDLANIPRLDTPQRRHADQIVHNDVDGAKEAAALNDAIRSDRIAVRYQPQIETVTGRVRSVEALARWADDVGVGDLFTRAARLGLDERLSRAMQQKAIREVADWGGPLRDVGLSLNILPCEISRDNYADWLMAQLHDAGVEPARITLEIVETALVVATPSLKDRLQHLRDLGVRVAVDDFGTGYSNLAYLTSLPLDQLKIDRALVSDIVGGERDRIVLKALVDLGRALGLETIVEGVEQFAQLRLLAEWQCELYQGFLGAGALNSAELARFVGAASFAAPSLAS